MGKPGLLFYVTKELPGLAPSEFRLKEPTSPRGAFDRAMLIEKIPVMMTWGQKPFDVRVYEFSGEPIWAEALPKHGALEEAFDYWAEDGALAHEGLLPALEHALLLSGFPATDVLAVAKEADPPILQEYSVDDFQEVYSECAAKARLRSRTRCWPFCA